MSIITMSKPMKVSLIGCDFLMDKMGNSFDKVKRTYRFAHAYLSRTKDGQLLKNYFEQKTEQDTNPRPPDD